MSEIFNFLYWCTADLAEELLGHGVKVGRGPWDTGTRDPLQNLRVGPWDPLQSLKVGLS